MRFEFKQAWHSPFKSPRVTIHPWIVVGIPNPLHSDEQATWNKPTPRLVCPAWRPSTHLLCFMYVCSPSAKSQHSNDTFPLGSLTSSVCVSFFGFSGRFGDVILMNQRSPFQKHPRDSTTPLAHCTALSQSENMKAGTSPAVQTVCGLCLNSLVS